MFRRTADRIIDQAHCAIAGAEMMVNHSFTKESTARALDQLARAQRYLSRAIAARDAWDSTEHGDYDKYPDVPDCDSEQLTLDM
jgi:hypothetical protein